MVRTGAIVTEIETKIETEIVTAIVIATGIVIVMGDVTVIIATVVVDTEIPIGTRWSRAIAMGFTPVKAMLNGARTITHSGRTITAAALTVTTARTAIAMLTGRPSATVSFADMTKATGVIVVTIDAAEFLADGSRTNLT